MSDEREAVEVIGPCTVEAVKVEAVLRRDVFRRALPDPFAFLSPEVLDLHFPDLAELVWPW
jgi:hypothetical protein